MKNLFCLNSYNALADKLPVISPILDNIFMRVIFQMVLCSFLLNHALPALAEDVIRIARPHSQYDRRHDYNNALLHIALEKTSEKYGSYRVEIKDFSTQRDRALAEMLSGQSINIHIVPTQLEWEEKTIPIRIPIFKGLLGYRLFLIKKQNIDKFSKQVTLSELKQFKAGLRQQWSTTRAMRALGFTVVTGSNYEGLFAMLMSERFDYFPRGVNEVFAELEARNSKYPDMIIEPTKALYLPLPVYVFVNPDQPRIAERIESGLMTMKKDGSFDRLFGEYFSESIKRADLSNRQIYRVENPFLSEQTPYEQKGFWLDDIRINGFSD